MAEYKGIKGFKVQTVSTDPAASIIATGTWASGGLNTSRNSAQGAGTQSAAWVAGGAPPNDGSKTEMELYNGTSWTEVNDLNTARRNSGASGTTTAGLIATGHNFPSPTGITNVESWDGTSWTEIAEVNTARNGLKGGGIQTASIFAGGYNGTVS
jgi:hypothetical protein